MIAATRTSLLFLAAMLMAMGLASRANAEVIAVQAQPAVWLAPVEDGVAALLADGTVVHVGTKRSRVVARSWTSEELWSCAGRIYGADGRGRIASTEGTTGPGVATYSTPACLPNGDLVALAADAQTVLRVTPDLEVVATASVDALADTILTHAPGADGAPGVVVLLAEPTFRYRHGVLGDEVEAAAIVTLDATTLELVARYRLPPPAVIEQRGVTPYAFGSRRGFYLTRSTSSFGAGVVALELIPTASGGALRPSAAAPPIGIPNRWLNLFANRGEFAYAVRTPHIGGPLERYRLTGSTLSVERFEVGVTNHVLGSRNVSLGVLLPTEDDPDWLALPTRDLRALRTIVCGEDCRVEAELRLSGRLQSNVVATRSTDDGMVILYAADDSGAIHRFLVDVTETSF